MPEKELSKLKKYVNERIECLNGKQFTGPQGEPATYDEGQINGELLAFQQVLHQINKQERYIRYALEVDEVVCEVSYEYIRANLASSGRVRERERLQEHIRAELSGYFHMSMKFKWERARKIADTYMRDRPGGGA